MAKVVKSVGRAIGKVFKVVGNFVGMLFSPPKVPKASANVASEARLNVTLVPEEPRKIVFGETALGTDLRFWETFGAKNERHVQVIASAGHAIESFGNLYVDEIPVPLDPYQPLPGNKYYQSLVRYTVTKGDNFGFSFGSGTRWNASATLWGCAYFVLDWAYSQDKLTNGIPSRITQVGKGAKVYDPRRDSTRGGSGSHRANNPDTWEYAPTDSNGKPIGRNNALQMLTYQLGLFIKHRQKNEWVLVGGRGVDPDDIDFNSFIVAANYCEVYGWYSDCVLSTGDSHSTNEGILEAASGGELVDVGGRFSYYVAADDTANAVVFLDENDIVGPIDWEPQPSLSEQFNELPGTFVDPAALFQTRPLPMAWDQAYYDEDGYKKRGGEMKLSAVQDPVQGQKLLRIALNRSRFPGVFSAPFNRKALKVQKHSLVRFSFTPFGWVDKLFRVEQQGIAETGGVQLVLKEEHASIYQPGTVVAVPPPSASYGGDRNIKIAVAGLTTVATGIESGTRAVDAIRVSWATDDQRILHTEVRFRQTSDADWQTSAPLRQDIKSAVISPLFPTTQYEIQVRHISIWNVPGDWASALRTTDAVTKNPVTGAITYADGTPIDDLKPAGPNANNTQANISAGFAGQGALATQNSIAWGGPYLASVPTNIKNLVGSEAILNEQISIGGRNLLTKAEYGTNVVSVPNGKSGWGYSLNKSSDAYVIVGSKTGLKFPRNSPLTVSFTAWFESSALSEMTLTADLFPNDLPEKDFKVYATPQRFVWEGFSSNSANMNSAQLRFFAKEGPERGIIKITDIQIENGNKATDWSLSAADVEVLRAAGFTGDLNADITSGNISAGFAGQGALATLNAVAWASQVTGVGKPADDATKSRVFTQQATPSNPTANDVWVKLNASGQAIAVAAWNGSAWVDGGNITAFYTAQGIVGQGPGATAPAHEVMNNALFGPGENRVAFSEFEKGTFGWVVMHNPNALAVSLDFNDWQGKKFGKFSTNFTSNSQQLSFGTSSLSRFRVTPGERLVVSIGVELQGSCRVNPVIRFYNESGVSISGPSISASLYAPTAYDTKCQTFVTVPAGAVRCGFEIYMISTGSGAAAIALTEPMVMSANAAQVLFPPFVAGPNAVGGADITADNTAGGIIGQGPGATAPGKDILNQYLPLGANQIVNSAFERGEYGWGRGGIAANRGTNYPGYWGVTNVAYVNVGGVLAAGSAVGAMYTVATQNLENIRRFAMPVAPGQKVFVSIFMGTHRCRGRVNVHWFRADGTGYPAAESFIGGKEFTGSSGGAINGDPANMERVGGFSIAPADAKYAMLSTAMIGTGGDNPFYFFTRGMLCILPLGQTEWPVYQAGPSDPIADKTNDNTAGGIVGQGPLATVSFVGNTYPNNAAAVAAGRAVGWQYWNSTTNALATVVAEAPPPVPTASASKSVVRYGPGNATVANTEIVTISPSGGAGTLTVKWTQKTFNFSGWTITAPNGNSTRFSNNASNGDKDDFFEWVATDGNGSWTGVVHAIINSVL